MMGSLHIRTKIIIITDGKPTESDTEDEVYESSGLNEVISFGIVIYTHIPSIIHRSSGFFRQPKHLMNILENQYLYSMQPPRRN